MREGNHMRAVLIIVIENCKNQTKSGYLQSLYQEKSFCFHGLDHILDREGMPVDSGDRRHLVKMDLVKKRTKIISDAETVPRTVKFCPIRNRLNTWENVFAVTIYSRQNASIQGVIRNSRGSACFRSGMEVLRMICECLPA